METLQREKSSLPSIRSCKTLPFAEYCRQWLTMIHPKLKASSYARYHSQVTNHIIPFWGAFCCDSLTVAEMTRFSLFLKEEQGLSSKTQKDVLVVLTSILKYAGKFEPGYLHFLPEYPRVARQEMRVLSRQEQSRLVEYLLQDMDYVKFGILLALLTGMRIGEICALQWSNISIQDEKILVRSTMQRIPNENDPTDHKTKIIITTPKTEKSIRTIPMSELAVTLCQKMQCADPRAYVLTGNESYMEPRTLQYRLRKYTADCHLEGVHFHTLRHTFATRCMEVGMETKILSDILGHANISITLDRYVHASFDIKKENMKKLSAAGM